jgi:hypothetical protein
MSEEHFHVHGAHDHEVEHQAHHGPGLAQQVAIFTAVLSTLGAIVSYQGGATQIEAMLYKNESVLKKAEASDQWNYYQAKSMKGHFTEFALRDSPPDRSEFYKKELERYNQEKNQIKAEAERLEALAKQANEKSEQLLHPHHRLAEAMTLIQIAIAMASITALTRKKWLLAIAGTASLGGIVLWVLAFLH